MADKLVFYESGSRCPRILREMEIRTGDLALFELNSGKGNLDEPVFGVIEGVDGTKHREGCVLLLNPSFKLIRNRVVETQYGKITIPGFIESPRAGIYNTSYINHDRFYTGNREQIAEALKTCWPELELHARIISGKLEGLEESILASVC